MGSIQVSMDTNIVECPGPVGKVQAVPNPGSSAEFAQLKSLAQELNPVVGYYDPLNLAMLNFWGQGEAATIGFLRAAEIKHGRIAMFGFVGYIVHENGIRWPWALSTSLPDYSSFDGLSAPAVWDALPMASKLQIVGVIGFLEVWSETKFVLESDGEKRTCRAASRATTPASISASRGRAFARRSAGASRTPCRSTCTTRLASPRTARPRPRPRGW